MEILSKCDLPSFTKATFAADVVKLFWHGLVLKEYLHPWIKITNDTPGMYRWRMVLLRLDHLVKHGFLHGCVCTWIPMSKQQQNPQVVCFHCYVILLYE